MMATATKCAVMFFAIPKFIIKITVIGCYIEMKKQQTGVTPAVTAYV